MEVCSRGLPAVAPHTHSRRGLWKASQPDILHVLKISCLALLLCTDILVKLTPRLPDYTEPNLNQVGMFHNHMCDGLDSLMYCIVYIDGMDTP